jgi:CBS domain-containing protein
MEPDTAQRRISALRVLPSESGLVGDLPVLAVPAVPAHLPMSAARKIAELKSAPLLLAERDGVLVGVVDERGLMSAADDAQVGDVVKLLDHCLTPTTPIVRARELLLRTGADALPVAAGALLLGVVTRTAIERAVRESARADLEAGRTIDLRRRRRHAA